MFIQSTADVRVCCPSCGGPLPATHLPCPLCLMAIAGEAPDQSDQRRSTAEWSRPAMAPTIDGKTHFVGPYQLLSEIARGGMGVVFEAWHPGLKRRVALKVIEHSVASHADVRARFRTEAEAAARLEHPNIVRVYEVGEDEGLAYIAMQLIEGEPLHRIMPHFEWQIPLVEKMSNRERSLAAQKKAARLMATVARAVQFAHDRGVLHRDIKPGNILIDVEGQPHLVDFGLARLEDSIERVTLPVTALGSPGYMAPEQLRDGAYDLTTAGDIFSLGAVLYELLCAEPAFGTGAALDVLMRSATQDVKPLRTINAEIHSDLEIITLRCLQREPTRRYANAGALANDLEAWLEGAPISARSQGRVETAWRWGLTHPVAASLVAALVIVSVVGAAAVFWQWRNATLNLKRALSEAERAQSYARAANSQAYTADMNLASFSLLNDNLVHARRLLLEHVPDSRWPNDLRQWEWHCMARQCQPMAEKLPSSVPISTAIRGYTQPGLFLSCGASNELRKLSNGQVVGHLPGRQTTALSRSGSQLATVNEDNALTVITLGNQNDPPLILPYPILKKTPHVKVNALAFGMDDHLLLASLAAVPQGAESLPGPLYCAAWNLASRELAWVVQTSEKSQWREGTFAVGNRSPIFVTPSDHGSCTLYDSTTGEVKQTIGTEAAEVTALAFAPEDDVLAIGTYETSSALLWSLATNSLIARFNEHRNAVTTLAFAADGQCLATGSADHTVRLWRRDKTWRPVSAASFREHSGGLTGLLWDETTSDLISLSNDGQLYAWRGAGDGLLDDIYFPPAQAIAVSAEHQLIAYLIANRIYIWHRGDPRPSILPIDLPTDIQPLLAISLDGQFIVTVTAKGELQWRRATTGRIVETKPSFLEPLEALRYTPDGSSLIVLSQKGQIMQLDGITHQVSSQCTLPELKHSFYSLLPALGLTFCSTDSSIYDIRQGKAVTWDDTIAKSPRRLVASDRWGHVIASTSQDGHLGLIDTTTHQVHLYCWPERAPITALAVSNAGNRIAISTAGTNTITLWDATTLRQVATLRCNLGEISDLSFAHHDGSLCVIGQHGATLLRTDTPIDVEAMKVASE